MDEPIGIPHSIPSKTFSHIRWSYFLDFGVSSVHQATKLISDNVNASPPPHPEVEANVDQLSPQRKKELDDTITSFQDNITHDNPKLKIP